MRLSTLFGLAVLTGIVVQCTSPTSTAGNGSDVGNAAVVGMIVDGSGNPVKGATVRMVPVSFDARQLAKRLAKTRSLTAEQMRAAILAAVDSAVTDSNGQYSFDTVDTGTYNVLADSGATMAFQDSVAIDDPDTQTTIPTDTLKQPGSLRGVVRLQPGHDSRTVFIIALGTFTVTAPSDSIGNFQMADMAEGTYSTRLLSTLDDYGVLDTTFSVVAGMAGVLADTIDMPYTGIPVPKGLSIVYDTLKQLVTLTWNTPTTGRAVKGYNVYCKHADSTSFVKIAGVIADTFYVDSTAVQDQTYEYKVAAVDTAETEGTKSGGVSVAVIGGYSLVASYGGGQGSGDGQFSALRSIAVDNSGNIYCADEGNHRIQKFDSSGLFITAWGTQGSDSGQFNQPKDIALDSVGNVFVADRKNHRIQKFDDTGSFLKQFGSNGSGDGQFQEPYAISILKGFVYVGDWYGQRVQKFDLEGNFLSAINVGNPVSGLAANDSLVFVIGNDLRIFKYSSGGTLLDTVYVSGKMADGINNIQINSISIHVTDSVLYLSNLSERKIEGIGLDGSNILQFNLNEIPEGAPQDVFVGEDGSIYIARYGGVFQLYRIE